ncbi:hypothetical protein PGB28_00615 [Primorskyibacter aestuariivivens]|uniref:hypothetical protein n=1 Tax=Primorskyibacter aestuariivivens TaxID=1888912 RepID=UPI0023012598|nr:hypothetical protein [Primorskyibacter aestuariivivens]MDA7426940.1 hypothetical protein [Primorskyibacter aestuariivivens]
MTDISHTQAPLVRFPLISTVAGLLRDPVAAIFAFLLLIVALVVVAVATWGLPVLGLIGVTLTPIYMVILLVISRG